MFVSTCCFVIISKVCNARVELRDEEAKVDKVEVAYCGLPAQRQKREDKKPNYRHVQNYWHPNNHHKWLILTENPRNLLAPNLGRHTLQILGLSFWTKPGRTVLESFDMAVAGW